jgi:hypothetical protein
MLGFYYCLKTSVDKCTHSIIIDAKLFKKTKKRYKKDMKKIKKNIKTM